MSTKTREEIEANLHEARIAGLNGRTKESLLKLLLVALVMCRYIDVMNDIERIKDSCAEEEKSGWEKLIGETVTEYNALKSANPDIMIYADSLNTGSSSVLGSVVNGLAEVFDYGVMGIGKVASAIGSIPIVAAATEVVACFSHNE